MSRLTVSDLGKTPNPIAHHYSHFRVGERLLLTGHSHQAWPDVAREAQLEAYDDAASLADEKWGRAFAKAERLRQGYRRLLDEPAAEIALASSTHDLVIRFLSALDLRRRPRIVTTDGEFHTLRRQLSRLGEEGIDLVRVPSGPVDTLAERLADEVDDRTAAVLVSLVLFETSLLVPGLGSLVPAATAHGAEVLVDAYHALGPVPVSVSGLGLEHAWIVGGGYKYLQLGEGNCFLRLPPHAEQMRPVVTGWFAEFDELAAPSAGGQVAYGHGASRFAGATYDPTSHYRAARVLDFFDEQGLTPELVVQSYRRQRQVLCDAFDELRLDDRLVTRDRQTPLDRYAGFLTLDTPHAPELQAMLAGRGVLTDNRGEHLRLGPAPYLSDDQLQRAVAEMGEVARSLLRA